MMETFYNTGRRINNGFIRLNHSVLEFSDRDIVSYYRKFNDLNGSKKLNSKFLNYFKLSARYNYFWTRKFN